MSAPPPPAVAPPPPLAVDDYFNDDLFWEAVALEMDNGPALKSAVASAPAPAPVPQPPPPPPEPAATAPVHRPSTAAARQSTLDRFVNSTGRRQEKESLTTAPAAPAVAAGAGEARPEVGAGEGCSRRQEDGNRVEDRFVESYTRRRREKEKKQKATAGGRRPGAPAGEGCSRQRNDDEVALEPCSVPLDHEAVQTWIYPTNIGVRDYQKYSAQKALFTNTLVALPTGLGKTFIAAVVMYNYFRWFPEGKIVFTAPSRPLVVQQIEACHNIVGIPQMWTVDMKGNVNPSIRSSLWKSKRVFFVTPQVLENDIRSGICMVKQLVCLVIDEAHKASGNYAYCTAVRKLMAARVPLRILALTATPGSKHADIQSVIDNICISELIHFDEEDSEVSRYVNTRKVELEQIPLDSNTAQLSDMLMDIIRPHVNRLRNAGVIDHRDSANWGAHELRNFREKFREAPHPNLHVDEIEKSFGVLSSLCQTRKLLLSHGIKLARDSLHEGRLLNLMGKNDLFLRAKRKMDDILSHGVSSPKIPKLIDEVAKHFNENDSKNSRVIIFSHFRASVNEIVFSLQSTGNRAIRPAEFIGQSSAGKRMKGQAQRGQTQKEQQAILQKFRCGEYNVLVATSIGEEGLDIMEVDLVICFDANISPLRMIQRMGRTGRKHEGRVLVFACEGQEFKGYKKKQESTRAMRKLLRNTQSFAFHASPRMVPHVYKPEVKFVKLTIEKYIPCSKKMKVDANGTSPIMMKISEQDGRLITRYFGACKEDMWKPSLIAFPNFQLSPSVVCKIPHSFRTTNMLIDAMQQLQDLSMKCGSPLQEPADVADVKGQACEGLDTANGNKVAMHQELLGVEGSCREVVLGRSVSVPSSPVNKYPIHSFFSGEYVTVDTRGNISITFVPVLPRNSAFYKDKKNADWHHNDQNKATPCISAADVIRTTVEFVHPAATSGKRTFVNSLSSSAVHSPEFDGHYDNVDEYHVHTTLPSKTLTSPREKPHTPCNAKLPQSTHSCQEDTELSPRLTLYMEEGIVPESPVEVSHLDPERDGAVSVGFEPKYGSPKSVSEGTDTNAAGCRKGPLNFEKNGQWLSGTTELVSSSRQNVLDQAGAKAEQPTHPSNVKICTPTRHTPTRNFLYDSFSGDCQLRSGGDASGSVQQAPKYRRLRRYGEKVKRVSSISLDACDTFGECETATKTMPNQQKQAMGERGKSKRRLDTYIDEEVEVSEDAAVSEDEDANESEDKYEDSFIDDGATPTGEFTQTEQGGGNNGDMMGFYRQSLLTQSPVVVPSRYLDVSDNSASRTGNASCSSEVRHNSIETPKELQTHHTINPSPSYQQSLLGRASLIQDQCEPIVANFESSTKLDSRKRKLSFQQPTAIPIINLEPEPAPESSSHLATGVDDDIYFNDAFFESLDLDAIEAEATELWRQKTAQSTQKPVESKKASDFSFAPPSFDLGF